MNLDLEKAKAYHRRKHFAALSHMGLEFFLLFCLVSTGITFFFKETAESVSSHLYLQITIYYSLFFLYLWIFGFFFSLYSEFHLEHAYGLSNQNFVGWFAEFLKKRHQAFALTLPLLLGLNFLILQ